MMMFVKILCLMGVLILLGFGVTLYIQIRKQGGLAKPPQTFMDRLVDAFKNGRIKTREDVADFFEHDERDIGPK